MKRFRRMHLAECWTSGIEVNKLDENTFHVFHVVWKKVKLSFLKYQDVFSCWSLEEFLVAKGDNSTRLIDFNSLSRLILCLEIRELRFCFVSIHIFCVIVS